MEIHNRCGERKVVGLVVCSGVLKAYRLVTHKKKLVAKCHYVESPMEKTLGVTARPVVCSKGKKFYSQRRKPEL